MVSLMTRPRGRPKGYPKSGGIQKGYQYPATISKAESRELLRQELLKHMSQVSRALVDTSTGIKHFMLRDPETGQFRRITDEKEIEAALNAPGAEEGSTYWIYTKDPAPQAIKEYLDRTVDKAIEPEQQVNHTGAIEIRWRD